jgi:hypothetical protein
MLIVVKLVFGGLLEASLEARNMMNTTLQGNGSLFIFSPVCPCILPRV